MDCKYVEERVWLYVEGDLGPKQQQAVAQHAVSCPRCARSVEEAASSQEWLRSSEPAAFDENFMATVRMGARNRIAELKGSRLRSVGMFARLNWKPLIIACPSLLLVCWFVVHWAIDGRLNQGGNDPLTMSGVLTRKEGMKPADAGPLIGEGLKDKDAVQHKRRIKKRVEQTPAAESEDASMLPASGEPPLRIEIQTDDPNVRIIWFASPGDGSIPTGSDK
jgi:hypothetical protein